MPSADRPFLAIFLRILAAFGVATLMMLVKLASARGIALPEIMFWRLVLTVPAVLGILAATGRLSLLRTTRLRNHALRATISTLGMASLFGAAILLTLPQASVLTFTSPLFAVIVAAFVLREAVGPWRWFAVLLGFCGVLIVAQPGAEGFNWLGGLSGLTAALVVVVVSYQLKDLARTDDPIACVFYLSLFASIYVGTTLPLFATAHDATGWLLLLAIGLAGLTSQYLLTLSLKFGAVSTILIMDYTLLLWSTLYSLLLWSDLPPHATWFGAPLIIGAGIIIIWREHRLSRRPPPVSTGEID